MEYSKILDVTQLSRLKSTNKSLVDDSLFAGENNNSLFLGPITNRFLASPIPQKSQNTTQFNIIDQLNNFNINYNRIFYAHSKHFHNLFIDAVFNNPIMAKYRVIRYNLEGKEEENLEKKRKESSYSSSKAILRKKLQMKSTENLKQFNRTDTDFSKNSGSILSRYKSRDIFESIKVEKSDIDDIKMKLVGIEKKMFKSDFGDKLINERLQELNRKIKLIDSIASKISYSEVELKDFNKIREDLEMLEKEIDLRLKSSKIKQKKKKKKSCSKSPKREKLNKISNRSTPNKGKVITPPPGGSISIIDNYNKKRRENKTNGISIPILKLRTEKIKKKIFDSPITPELGKSILKSDRNNDNDKKSKIKREEGNLSNSLYIGNLSKSGPFGRSNQKNFDIIPEKSNEFASPRPHNDIKSDLENITKDLVQSPKEVSEVTEKLEISLKSEDSPNLIFKHHTDNDSSGSDIDDIISRKSTSLSHEELNEDKREEEKIEFGSLAGCSYIDEGTNRESGFDDESVGGMMSDFRGVQYSEIVWEQGLKFFD